MKLKSVIFTLFSMLATQAFAGNVTYHFWEGKVNGQEVKMSCAIQDGIMTGEVFQIIEGMVSTYEVAGYERDGMYDVRVYTDGDATDVEYLFFMRGKVKGDKFVGIEETTGKKFKLSKFSDEYARPLNRLQGIYSSPYVEGKTYKFSGWDRGGMYVYENAMRVKGELTLWGSYDDDTFKLSIRRDSGSDHRGNDALVEASGLNLPENGDFIYTIPGCGYSFQVRFCDHFLIIRSLAGSPSGCFGSGASITGIYIMIPAKG